MSHPNAEPETPILERVSADARFVRARSWAGDGEVLLASTPQGTVAIAPPATPLTFGEPRQTRAHWRVAWYPLGEDGVDLDGGPEQEARSSLRELWPLEQIKNERPFLRAMFLADARHHATAHKNFAGVTEAECAARVEPLRQEWAELFPHDRWPLDDGDATQTQTAPASPWSLSAALASAADRFAAVLRSPQVGTVHGVNVEHEAENKTDAHKTNFGPAVTVIDGGEGGTPVLAVDFDLLREAYPGVDPNQAYVLTPENDVVGTAFFVDPAGLQRAPLRLRAPVNWPDARVAWQAPPGGADPPVA